MSLISGKNLVKRYFINIENFFEKKFTTAVNNIESINIEKGEFLCIMGASGSGKSTLLNLLAAIDLPTSGVVTVQDQDIRKMSEENLCTLRYENMGYIFQDFNLLENYTIFENIAMPLIMRGVNRGEIDQRVKTVTSKLKIDGLIHQYPTQCSGGQLQRTAIARAMITNPTIIVADEPTGNLDAITTEEVLAIFGEFYCDGNTILMVSHDSYVASFASRVLFLKDGEIKTEIERKQLTQKEFFDKIIKIASTE